LEQLVISQTSDDTLSTLLARGQSRLEQHDFISAERDFSLCVRVQPAGAFAPSCLYHSAIAEDELGQHEEALFRFLDLVNRFPRHELALPSSLRALRVAVHLEKWSQAATLSEGIVNQRKSLKPFELVLPYGTLAMDSVLRGDDVQAEQYISRARSIIDDAGLDVPGRIHRDLAVVYFALGEVRRLRAARLTFLPMPTDFAEVLEARCQLILDGQSAYSDAMRAYDAHWSTMAGYRVGELYASLHTDVMALIASRPVDTVERRQLLEGAMRLRYAVLVQKARHMLRHTLDMAERMGEKSEWVDRVRVTLSDLNKRNQDEEDAIARLPYSREALTYALARLAEGKRISGKQPERTKTMPQDVPAQK
jgi:tetratricopeptide (TPR) repeat protein